MIEIRNLKLALSGGKATGVAYDADLLRLAVSRKLGIDVSDIDACSVARRAVDARKRGDVHYVASVRASLHEGAACEERLVASLATNDVVLAKEAPYEAPKLEAGHTVARPVVVGAGPAGLFAALSLAQAGMAPILIERGAPAEQRSRDVAKFAATGKLNTQSNIQFGAGGAGTFSDGKLTTGTNAPEHAWILKTFVEAGASSDILWQAMPHIGSDVLPGVVDKLVERIREAGGDVRWYTRMCELVVEQGCLAGVRVAVEAPGRPAKFEEIRCSQAILACGHSARDVFSQLKEQGLTLEPKVFSMGVRIEHPQNMINKVQYGGIANSDALPVASYKLSCHLKDGRGVYSFCMCPGGTVVAAASEEGGVVTNGMSEFARDGRNANSGFLANVLPEDIPGIADDPLAGVALQRRCEQAAFAAGGGDYKAPAQLLTDFRAKVASRGAGHVQPTYPLGVKWGSVGKCLPDFVDRALRAAVPIFAKRLEGFDRMDAVLTGVETRSSSPVRIVRRSDDLVSVDVEGLYPCGEGAGYAGGIMSAAADGLRCAAAVVRAANAR